MKEKLMVLFGGRSSEHEISCKSAVTVISSADPERYELVLVGITKEGRWLLAEDLRAIEDGSWRDSKKSFMLSADTSVHGGYVLEDGKISEYVYIDVIFPVLHGLYGEDGTVQGLFELSGIPYAGSGVFASAAAMDKVYTKVIVDTLGIRQADYAAVHRTELKHIEEVDERIEAKLSYPMFVKPSCAGSSVGVSKAENRKELEKALYNAAIHDSKILVEETIVGREIECAILGGEEVEASGTGEIIAAADFYDYDAKYNNSESVTDTHPALPEGVEEEIRTDAVRIFKALGCYGLARVDFFLDKRGVVFNEINTLPGFTGISMYPMLWEDRGVDKKRLVQILIDLSKEHREH
ncbi:MAG: D-alanine--D-alanine ligase [Lachnospiraceae bacterium]|nr:D-alanine--D-alanine ligase [Lachnospiraceae bacterium]